MRLQVTVTRGDAFITGLPQQAFTVLEDGKPQTIATFQSREEPVSVVLVIDDSGSRRDLMSVRRIAQTLVNAVNPESEIGVMSFRSDETHLDLPLSQDRAKIAASLRPANLRGGSLILDSCLAAVQYLAKAGKYDKRIVVMLTDGDDNASRATPDEVRAALVRNDVLIYALRPVDSGRGTSRERSSREQLTALAGPTGGTVYESKMFIELEQAAERIAREIRSQYVLTYTPANQALNGKVRKITVKVDPPDKKKVTVRTRSGRMP